MKCRSLTINLKILLCLLVVCCAIVMTSGIVYYSNTRNLVLHSIDEQVRILSEYVKNEFEHQLSNPIKETLNLLTTAPQVENYLMSAENEKIIHRAEVEKLFFRLTKKPSRFIIVMSICS